MAAESLTVSKRETTGRLRNKRLRASGQVPAVLYGHGEECINLAVAKEALWSVIRHGGHLVELNGAVKDTALIREVQWDTYGTEVIHVDLNRVSATERVQITVPVEIRGEAIGLKSGGVISFTLHQLQIECTVLSIPDKLEVRINNLELGKAIHANEVTLPEGATLLTDGHAVVVSCVVPKVEDELAAPAGEGAEPEVITRKKEEGEEGDEEKK